MPKGICNNLTVIAHRNETNKPKSIVKAIFSLRAHVCLRLHDNNAKFQPRQKFHLIEIFTLLYEIDVQCLQNISLQFARGDLCFIAFSRKGK